MVHPPSARSGGASTTTAGSAVFCPRLPSRSGSTAAAGTAAAASAGTTAGSASGSSCAVAGSAERSDASESSVTTAAIPATPSTATRATASPMRRRSPDDPPGAWPDGSSAHRSPEPSTASAVSASRKVVTGGQVSEVGRLVRCTVAQVLPPRTRPGSRPGSGRDPAGSGREGHQRRSRPVTTRASASPRPMVTTVTMPTNRVARG